MVLTLLMNRLSRFTGTWLLLASDIIGLLFCFDLAFLLRLEQSVDWRSPLLYGLTFACILGLYLTDTYKVPEKISRFWLLVRVLLSLLVTVIALTSLIYLAGLWGSEPLVGRGIIFISMGLFALWAIATRIIVSKWFDKNPQVGRFLVIGGGEKVLQFGKQYQADHTEAQFVVLTDNQLNATVLAGNNHLEMRENDYLLVSDANNLNFSNSNDVIIDRIENFCLWEQQSWSAVLIDYSSKELSERIIQQLMTMRLRGIYVYNLADFCEQFWQKIPPAYIQDDWFAFTSGFSILHNPLNFKFKQLLDFAAAAVLILITLPVTLLAAIAVKLDSPGAIFYSQVRTGLNGEKFRVHKFRSMRQDAEQLGAQWAQEKDPRITKVGRFLRLTRIDELPQLWNVLRGDMSLIGPRPERPEFDAKLRQEIPYYDVRYLVKPGITGWAQVCYPYGASVEDAYQKVAYDLYYIKNYSLLLDFAIVLKTLRVVILGKGR
ncbi:MAG TPA: exopolysaccharide biosynthesis polyprenyl glycosylphosphotransferase [Xenococcaceae cyanobacterium]